MGSSVEILTELIKDAFDIASVDIEKIKNINREDLHQIYKISKSHDVSPMITAALDKRGLLGIDEEIGNKFRKQQMLAVFRYEHINYEISRISEAFERERIPFIMLKGSVIRKYYPEPWMRTSCDIDILVKPNDVDRAASVLAREYGYENKGKGSHDISLFSPGQTHIELHYDLVEDGLANEASLILRSVWDIGVVFKEDLYMREMTDEMFYFYHIAHMAKHFENGGCGIKPFVDIWILDNIAKADIDGRNALLEKGGLLKFAEAVRKLSRVWFNGEARDPITSQLEDYVLRGGVYGTNQNRVTVQQQKRGGRLKYALSRIFLPYDVIKFHYPILEKHRFLTPFMEVRRWFKLLFRGSAKQSFNELKYNSRISDDKAANTREFLENIGL